MILVASPSKPFQFTPKATPRRKVVIADYTAEIDALYTAVEQSSQGDIKPPMTWDLKGITDFVRATVRNVVETDTTEDELEDDVDIFQSGADRYVHFHLNHNPANAYGTRKNSLSATWIRNSILLALRKTGPLSSSSIRALPIDLVFNFPSVSTLSAFLFGVTLLVPQNQGVQVKDEEEDDEVLDTSWTTELGKVGQTIVKLRKSRKGEPPLIVIHGAGGTIHAFGPLQEKFRSALWVIQVTPDVPLTSLEAQTTFYYQKIKVNEIRLSI
jgi:hypothetical protein